MDEDVSWRYERLSGRCCKRKWSIASNLPCCRISFVLGDVDEMQLGEANGASAGLPFEVKQGLQRKSLTCGGAPGWGEPANLAD
jgi:hypothetical protein